MKGLGKAVSFNCNAVSLNSFLGSKFRLVNSWVGDLSSERPRQFLFGKNTIVKNLG